MRNLRPEHEIMKEWKNNPCQPLVSISCITYNHEKYIEDALQGFLSQETDFPFEILIHDDASTDRTVNILHEYEVKYPKLIKPIYQKENQYSRGIKISATYQHPRALGKYIAMCEGDDYWTNPLKLQKQTDFLDNNPNFSICFHNMQIIYEDEPHLNRVSNIKQKGITNIKTLARCNYIYTASCIFRKNFSVFPDWYYKCPVGDYPLHLLNAQYGKIKFINEVMGVYRVHKGGVWENTNLSYRLEKWAEMLEILKSKFDSKVNEILNNSLYKLYFELAGYYLKNGNLEKNKFYLMKYRKNNPNWWHPIMIVCLRIRYLALNSKILQNKQVD